MGATRDSWKRIPFISGVPIPYSASFSREEIEKLQEGLIPEAMEDKWFAFYEDLCLFLHHSWTGEPVYRVTLLVSSGGAAVVEALCVVKAVEETGPEYQATLLDFLISNLLLGRAKPFPLPPGVREAKPGLLQHLIAGTGFAQIAPPAWRRRWWFSSGVQRRRRATVLMISIGLVIAVLAISHKDSMLHPSREPPQSTAAAVARRRLRKRLLRRRRSASPTSWSGRR